MLLQISAHSRQASAQDVHSVLQPVSVVQDLLHMWEYWVQTRVQRAIISLTYIELRSINDAVSVHTSAQSLQEEIQFLVRSVILLSKHSR
jgi:hypothetical protein